MASRSTARAKTGAGGAKARGAKRGGGGEADSSGRSAGRRGRNDARGPDALELLAEDHRRVEQLIDDFEDSEGDEAEQIELAQQLCDELTVHADVEEHLFYPAAREVLDDAGVRLLDEALVEHAAARDLIAKVEGSDPSDELFRAQVKVLGDYVRHHVVGEENELFELVRRSSLDRRVLGFEVQARREALLGDMGLDAEVTSDDDDEEGALADAADDDARDEGGNDATPPPSRGRGRKGSRPTAH